MGLPSLIANITYAFVGLVSTETLTGFAGSEFEGSRMSEKPVLVAVPLVGTVSAPHLSPHANESL
jgi:hypothetical protein